LHILIFKESAALGAERVDTAHMKALKLTTTTGQFYLTARQLAPHPQPCYAG